MDEQMAYGSTCILASENHLYCHLTKDLTAILKPLTRYLGIDYFDYQRYYHNGRLLLLTPWSSYCQRYFAKNLYPNFIEFDRNKENIVFLAETAPMPSCAEEPSKFIDNVNEAYKNDIFHRVYFVYRRNHCFEIFGFGSSKKTNCSTEFYWKRLEMLKKFQLYFYSKAQMLIQESEKQKVQLPKFLSSTKTLQQVCAEFSQEEFMKAISLKYYPVITSKGPVKLTSRELQCLRLVYERYTSKEMAKLLELSPRTVEEYLNNIKNKFKCESKIELMSIAADSPIINFFE